MMKQVAMVLLAAAAVPAMAAVPASAPAANAALSLDANTAYLQANAHKPGVKTTSSGLQYRIIRNGLGRRPAQNDVVAIEYSAKLIDGTVVDGTSPGLAASVRASGVIAGLREALTMMHEGDQWQLAVPGSLGFPIRLSNGADIPPRQTLLFDITLVSTYTPAPGTQTDDSSPISLYSVGRQTGATFTIHP